MFIKRAVTTTSSDEAIKSAIEEAGLLRHPHRTWDWPERDEQNRHSWVKPGDIGNSTSKDRSLRLRLISMAKAGILEKRHESGGPRFRVKIK